MGMLIRTIVLYLNYLLQHLKFRKQIWFRGFSVICALKGSNIDIDNTGEPVRKVSHPVISPPFRASQKADRALNCGLFGQPGGGVRE